LLSTLITSKTRLKLLLKFFLNEQNSAYLRGLEQEFGEGSNAIRIELNKFENAGLLRSYEQGNKRFFTANPKHPLFRDIQSMVRKYFGLDTIIEKVAQKLGNLEMVLLTGKIAQGLDNGIIELVLVGHDLDKQYLAHLCDRAEQLLERKISYVIFQPEEFEAFQEQADTQLLLIYN
jgi:hypothetical protein